MPPSTKFWRRKMSQGIFLFMLQLSFSTSTLLERSKRSLFTEAVPGHEGRSLGRHFLQEVRPVSYHQSGSSQEQIREGQHAQYWEQSRNQLQELREVNLQELQEAELQEVQEVHLEDAAKVKPEDKAHRLADLQELLEADVQEVEEVLLQEVEPVASLQEVVQLPWLTGLRDLTRSRKVVNKLGKQEEEEKGALLLQEVKPVYKGTSQRRTRPATIASKSQPSLFANRGVRVPSTSKPKRRIVKKLHKKRFEEKLNSKSRTVKRQSLKTNSGKEEETKEVAGEVFTVRKLKTQFIPAETQRERVNPKLPSRGVKRSYSSAPTVLDHFQRVRPVFRGWDSGERPNDSSVVVSLPEDDYHSLLTTNFATRKIPQRYQDLQNGVQSESYSFEKGEGGTQIIITLTNSPDIHLWQASSPDIKGDPSTRPSSSYPEKEEVDIGESEDFEVGPVIAAVTAEEEEQRGVPDPHFAPSRQESRKGSYRQVSVRGSVSPPQGPPSQSPPRVRLYDHPHSDHHLPGECDDNHDAHHHHDDDHRYRNSMPRPVIAAVTAELEEPEDLGPAPPSPPPPPGPPAPPPTQRPMPIPTLRPVPVIPAVVGPTYRPPTSYLPPTRPAPPPGRPRPSYNGQTSSYGRPTASRPSSALTHFTPVANPAEANNPSSPANSLASSNHYHIHVTSPRQLTQVQAVLASTVAENEGKSQDEVSYNAPPILDEASYKAPPILEEPNYRPSPPTAAAPQAPPAVNQPSYQASNFAQPGRPQTDYAAPQAQAQSSYRAPPAQAQPSYGAPPAQPQSNYGSPSQDPNRPPSPPPNRPSYHAPPSEPSRPSYRAPDRPKNNRPPASYLPQGPPRRPQSAPKRSKNQLQKFLCLFWCYLDQEENETH